MIFLVWCAALYIMRNEKSIWIPPAFLAAATLLKWAPLLLAPVVFFYPKGLNLQIKIWIKRMIVFLSLMASSAIGAAFPWRDQSATG